MAIGEWQVVQHSMRAACFWPPRIVHVLAARSVGLDWCRPERMESHTSVRIGILSDSSIPDCAQPIAQRTSRNDFWHRVAATAHHYVLGLGNVPSRNNGGAIPTDGLPHLHCSDIFSACSCDETKHFVNELGGRRSSLERGSGTRTDRAWHSAHF